MATVHIVNSFVNSADVHGKPTPVQSSRINANGKQTMVSTASNQVSTVSVADPNKSGGLRRNWSITVTGGNVWVDFGPTPDAVANKTWLILDGQTREFGCVAGDFVAVADAV